jgi:hypothetical protein
VNSIPFLEERKMLQQPRLRLAIQLQIQTFDPELELPREFVLPDPRR